MAYLCSILDILPMHSALWWYELNRSLCTVADVFLHVIEAIQIAFS